SSLVRRGLQLPWLPYARPAARLRLGGLREGRPADGRELCRRLLPAHRPQVDRALELLSRLLAVPTGRDRPGRLSPRAAGQLVQSRVDKDEPGGAAAGRAGVEPGRVVF